MGSGRVAATLRGCEVMTGNRKLDERKLYTVLLTAETDRE